MHETYSLSSFAFSTSSSSRFDHFFLLKIPKSNGIRSPSQVARWV